MRRLVVILVMSLAIVGALLFGFEVFEQDEGKVPTSGPALSSLAPASPPSVSDSPPSASPSPPSETPTSPGGRPPETNVKDANVQVLFREMLAKPPSFWNLSRRQYVVQRVQTQHMLTVPEEVRNPLDFPGLTLAVLDITEGGDPRTGFDRFVVNLYMALFDQKIFTAALPVIVFWEPSAEPSRPRWSVAVPVSDNTTVTSPLRLARIPPFRAQVFRLTAKDGEKMAGARKEQRPTLYERCLATGRALLRKVKTSGVPGVAFVRLPYVRSGPFQTDSLLEVFFVYD